MTLYNDELPDISELFQAYFDCRRGKRNSTQAVEYEMNFEDNLFDLYDRLINRSYVPSEYIFFVLVTGKPREVWASKFEDRIVHHLLYNRLYDRFVNSFIHDSYSCIPGKGTHRAVDRLDHFVRSATMNYKKTQYFLQCDVQSFYMNINKDILFDILSKKISSNWWLWLVKTILYSDPRKNYRRNSPAWKNSLVPRNKSLFSKNENVGLPIGNLSSQFFANIYLDELDQYCKHKLKTRHYIRYADDIVVIGDDPKQLNNTFELMNEYAINNLGICFHPFKKIIQPTSKGINFVGYIVKHHRKYIRNDTVHNFKSKDYDCSENPHQIINSYFGFFKHANCYNIKQSASESFLKSFQFDQNLSKAIE